MPIEQAERIAHIQVAWAILLIILFGFVIDYLVRTSDKRDKKLMDFREQTQINLEIERRLCTVNF